jgi:hypothetical protein
VQNDLRGGAHLPSKSGHAVKELVTWKTFTKVALNLTLSLAHCQIRIHQCLSHCQSQSESSSCSGRFRAADHLLRNSRSWQRENKECLYYCFFDSNLRKQAMFGTYVLLILLIFQNKLCFAWIPIGT